MSLQTVPSRDGTPIAFERNGSGPSLLLVHGATVSRNRWRNLVPLLATSHSVLAMDRRGRGDSGNSPAHAVEREVEDVLSVVQAVESPVSLFGHSSGALLCLQAAERASIARLVLYEPPVGQKFDTLAPRLDALLAAGDRLGVAETFLREGPGRPMPTDGPERDELLSLAHTMPHDARIQSEFELVPARLQAVTVPTLFLVGTESPSWMREGNAELARWLPNSEMVELPGQGHIAHVLAPGMVALEVLRFLA
jgi:pimeloyl-ACP methyl ester carboxylesterase